MIFFPDSLPCPDISGPTMMTDQSNTEFFYYAWPELSWDDLCQLNDFLRGRTGVPLNGWTNPNDNQTWIVTLSDLRIPTVNNDNPDFRTFTVELVAFILGGSGLVQ